MTRLLLLLAAVPLAAPATTLAADPVRLSPADAGWVSLERVVGGTVYSTVSADAGDPAYTLMRRTAAGNLQTIARRSDLLAEAAPDVGVVVETQEALVPQDTGGSDVYLIRPDGSPLLLTAGRPWNGVVGNSFGSLTPDRRGIVFASAPDLNDDPCTNTLNGTVCDLYGWRDGVLRTLDDGHKVQGFVPIGGFATDDFSQVFATGGDVRNAFGDYPVVVFLRPPTGGPARPDRTLAGVSADHRTAVLDGMEDEHGLVRWTGDAPATPIGPADPQTRVVHSAGPPTCPACSSPPTTRRRAPTTCTRTTTGRTRGSRRTAARSPSARPRP